MFHPYWTKVNHYSSSEDSWLGAVIRSLELNLSRRVIRCWINLHLTCYTVVKNYGGRFQTRREFLMSKPENEPLDNVISDQTGQFDLRFILWRHFCAENNLPVETLPSQLSGEMKDKWDELKSTKLRGR